MRGMKTIQFCANKKSRPQILSCVYIIWNKTFLCCHIVNTNNLSAFKSTSSASLNQSVIQTYGAQNERMYLSYNVSACVYVCMYMIVTDSHWLPMDRIVFRGKRERRKGGMGREAMLRAEGRIQPPLSLVFFHPLPPLSSPSCCIYNALSV